MPPPASPSSTSKKWKRTLLLLYIPLCFEIGVVLLVLPWVAFWQRNFFVQEFQWVNLVAMNHFVRGAISGLGLVNIGLAVWEFWRLKGTLASRESG